MTLDEELEKEITEIMGRVDCPKEFKCYRSGFQNLCKARDIGVKLFLECLEETSQKCKFSLVMGHCYLCQCPVRYYILKRLQK